jgi:hypothetical protein
MDLYSGEIIAYLIAYTQDISMVTDIPTITKLCILDNDQGSVYIFLFFKR